MASRRRPHPARSPRRPPRKDPFPILPVALGAAIAAFILAFAVLALRPQEAPAAAAPVTANVTTVPQDTGSCRGSPAFATNPEIVGQTFAQGGSIAFATDQVQKGLVLLSAAPGVAPFQAPSWDDAGYLGSIAYDDVGNIYAAPTPRLSLQDNPLAGLSTLWRVDAATGEMRPFVSLAGAASERNPFGVLGLTYDCAHRRLYVGSVLGSTPSQERGGVVAIEHGGQQTPILSDFDAMGVLVVHVGAGHQLYAASARRPEIIAVDLDKQGNLAGEPRQLLDLTAAGATPSERARKIRLTGGRLVVDLVPFNFTFQASASNKVQLRRASWAYDPAQGWLLEQPAAEVTQ